ncbi:MAG TPA: P-II family nitrogen regulator [bacterium]|nr:P-II family nitrogen regulator [Candidatus Omnitrophota bacterium]HOJ59167.1 P-II family nitrogen regulator [bacterium]HOL92736.1 P-II family nitrogen regulator [bacterium]HPO99049.1 P-II family nitrogen regulator [bacterium]
MNKIEAIIRPHKLEDLRAALEEIGITGMTVTEVRGFGRQKGHHELYRGREYSVNFLPKIKVEIAVKADMTEQVIDTIRATVNTGQVGDGKIFVFAMSDAVRIRTGERAEEAL